MRGSMKKRNKKTAKILAVVLAAALGVCVPETTLQAAETLTSVQIQMPGFVVEQFSAPRLMNVTKNAVVRTLPDNNAAKLTSVTAGNTVWGWGQTNTGWYFVQVGSQIGYVRYEAATYATQDQIAVAQAQAAAAAQQAAAAQAQAAQQAQIAAAAANQPAVAAGIVFIGDSRMVTLKDAVERNLGSCAAAVVAKTEAGTNGCTTLGSRRQTRSSAKAAELSSTWASTIFPMRINMQRMSITGRQSGVQGARKFIMRLSIRSGQTAMG